MTVGMSGSNFDITAYVRNSERKIVRNFRRDTQGNMLDYQAEVQGEHTICFNNR